MRAILALVLIVLMGAGYLFSEYLHTHEELITTQDQLALLMQENEKLRNLLKGAEARVTELTQQVAQLGAQVASLQGQVLQLQEANQTLTDSNTQLQQQVSQQASLASLADFLAGTLSSSGYLAILLPAIPMSMAATYVMVRSRTHTDPRKMQAGRSTSRRTITAQLTEEEMKHLIHLRRNR